MCRGLCCLSFNSKFPMAASTEKGFGRGNQTLREHNFSWKTYETWKKNWSAIERVRPCVEVLYPVTPITCEMKTIRRTQPACEPFLEASRYQHCLNCHWRRDSCVKWPFYCNTPQHTLSTESYSFLCCSKKSCTLKINHGQSKSTAAYHVNRICHKKH